MHLSIEKASNLLGVSIQTLRNWDAFGYFPAMHTAGGHRRYSTESIESFLKNGGKKIQFPITSWELQQDNHVRKLLEKEIIEKFPAKDCGGFKGNEVSILLRNQSMVSDPHPDLNLKLFEKILKSFSTPYLFGIRVLSSVQGMIYSEKIRYSTNSSGLPVEPEESETIATCESEEVCCMTRKISEEHDVDFDHIYDKSKSEVNEIIFNMLVEKIDQESVDDCCNNAGTITSCKISRMNEKIKEIMNFMDKMVAVKEPKYILVPPELKPNELKFKLLTKNLSEATNTEDLDYKVFMSRMMPSNKILIGTKGQAGFDGYVFCPYLIMCKYNDERRLKGGMQYVMRTGKKLLREGSKFFGLITVE